ncbi:MAG: hypothetical protein ACJAY8_000516 [Sphingobacteriales bacterium]|jgi:hypothetical protein
MKTYKIIISALSLFIISLFLPNQLLGQQNLGVKEQRDQAKKAKYYAAKAVLDITENGALLVRLRSYQNEIDYWEKTAGEKGKAGLKKVQEKKAQKAEALMEAFQVFGVCPVYFFYSNDTRAVKDGDYSKLLKTESTDDIQGKRIFFLDTDRFPSASMNTTFNGFGVFDEKFEYLPDPFPNGIRKYEFFKFIKADRTYAQMVVILDERLRLTAQQIKQGK